MASKRITTVTTSTFSKRFLNYKSVKSVLNRTNISKKEEHVIDEFFKVHNFRAEQDSFKRYATWLNQGKDNWAELNNELTKHKRMSVEYFVVLYGKESGTEKWNTHVNTIIKNLDTLVEYWVNRGHSEHEAKIKISEIQRARSKKALKNRNHAECSVRCREYWVKKGHTLGEADKLVSDSQRRDLSYFVSAYGDTEGIKRHASSIKRRKHTWKNKSHDELVNHAKKTLPKTHNPCGQEMQAIRMFIEQNDIKECNATLMYGSPIDQFFQWLPNIGFRRYDLAILDDKNEPCIIFEYHGPGHINFSDYTNDIHDEIFSVNGRKLYFLGTYGSAFYNDLYKKKHIEHTYPSAIYCVAWEENLKNKDMRIENIKCNRN